MRALALPQFSAVAEELSKNCSLCAIPQSQKFLRSGRDAEPIREAKLPKSL